MKKILATILSVILLLTTIPMAYAEETNTYKEGDIIQFGSYPQSEVKDEALIAELNALAPEWAEWTVYDYYAGSDPSRKGDMAPIDYMRYIDVEYNGECYRAVKFTDYRPYRTCLPGSYISSENPENVICLTEQIDNGYICNNIYWFKFEPIEWRVLNSKTKLVMCETIIDSQPYNNTVYGDNEHGYWFNDPSFTTYCLDYVASSIRNWLNEDFYNVAFTVSEKNEIAISTLNNDGYSTIIGVPGYEILDSDETNDKIFLLSYDEVLNEENGFLKYSEMHDDHRVAYSSDYAKCQGLYVVSEEESSNYSGNSAWSLRSPGYVGDDCCCVMVNGQVEVTRVDFAHCGIRPALRFNDVSDKEFEHAHSYSLQWDSIKFPSHLEKGEKGYLCFCGDYYIEYIDKLETHTYSSYVTPPTCTEKGYTTYVCECGNSYTDNEVNPTGHDFEGSKCKNCDFNKADNCSCNCHKGGISGFFWKIINFFNKLFKSKQYCGCGAKHW